MNRSCRYHMVLIKDSYTDMEPMATETVMDVDMIAGVDAVAI